ncbi:MAG: DUF6713 family protein [Erythrobacteraceae bacterium]
MTADGWIAEGRLPHHHSPLDYRLTEKLVHLVASLSIMRTGTIYFLMLSLLFTHEIDAAFRHEWRVLPITSFLPDELGREIFIWAHVPLFAGILLASNRERVRVAMAAFCVIHVGLHWLFRNHPAYEFNNASSWGLILGAGALGLGFLFALWRAKRGGIENLD